jgi:hypothetical protein
VFLEETPRGRSYSEDYKEKKKNKNDGKTRKKA